MFDPDLHLDARKLGLLALRRCALCLGCLGRLMPLARWPCCLEISGGLIGFELVSLLRARRVREFKVLLRSTFGHSQLKGDDLLNQELTM